MTTLATVAALKAHAYIAGDEIVFVQGYSTIGDGGEGLFFWDNIISSGYNSGTIIQYASSTAGAWKRLYSGYVSVGWFGAKGDNVNDDTIAIQSAINFCKSFSATAGTGLLLKAGGSYKITSSLTIDGGVDIIGNGASFYGAFSNGSILLLGTSTTAYNGFKGSLSNLNFTTAGTTNLNGITINATGPEITNCTFSNLTGSGIVGYYAQYSRINNCGFSNITNYGIQLYSVTDATGSNDIVIENIYQNIGNGLGGMYLHIQNSVVRKCTFTDLPLGLHIEGWNNLVEFPTFESSTGAVARTLLEVNTENASPTIISGAVFVGLATNTVPIKILTGSGKVIVKECTFNITPAGSVFVVKQDDATILNLTENSYANTGITLCSTNASVVVSNYEMEVSNLPTSGTGTYLYSSSFQLPCYGFFLVSITSGGNGNDYINHRGCHSFIVNFFNNYNSYQAVNGYSGRGNQISTDITGTITYTGVFTITCQNAFNGVGSITVSIAQIGNSEL